MSFSTHYIKILFTEQHTCCLGCTSNSVNPFLFRLKIEIKGSKYNPLTTCCKQTKGKIKVRGALKFSLQGGLESKATARHSRTKSFLSYLAMWPSVSLNLPSLDIVI